MKDKVLKKSSSKVNKSKAKLSAKSLSYGDSGLSYDDEKGSIIDNVSYYKKIIINWMGEQQFDLFLNKNMKSLKHDYIKIIDSIIFVFSWVQETLLQYLEDNIFIDKYLFLNRVETFLRHSYSKKIITGNPKVFNALFESFKENVFYTI